MTIFKRIFASLMVAVMVLTAAPVSGFVGVELNFDWFDFNTKASAATYSGICGDNLTWSLNTSNGELVIDGTGEMYDYDYESAPWYSYCLSIRTVIIGDSIKTIGDFAFFSCLNLVNITIPDSVTTIGERVFLGCDNLTNITIPDSVIIIDDTAFWHCRNLTSVILGNSVTIIGNYAFADCDSLKSVTIPRSVITIGEGAFSDCDNLTNIEVDAKNKAYLSDENGILFNKNKTELVQYPIGNERTSYTIPHGITIIDSFSFSNCDNLTSVIIPDSVKSIDYVAFEDCDSITGVTIPISVTNIGNSVFSDCDSLTNITVDEGNTAYSTDEYGVLFNKDKTELIQYPMGNDRASYKIPNSVTTIGNFAFFKCTGLTSVTIHDNVKIIDYSAFHNCTRLIDVYFVGTEEQWKEIKTYEYNEDLINATIHFNYCNHSYDAVVTVPTCTEQGYTTYTCECGDSYVDDYVPEKGHDEGVWSVTKPSTPTESGVMHLFCGECGFVLETKVIPATGKVSGVAISDISLDYKASTTITPSITVDSGVKYTVTYSSSNPSVASVDANGKVTTSKTGSATITVTVTDEFGNTVTDTCDVSVNYNLWQWIIVIVLFGWIWY